MTVWLGLFINEEDLLLLVCSLWTTSCYPKWKFMLSSSMGGGDMGGREGINCWWSSQQEEKRGQLVGAPLPPRSRQANPWAVGGASSPSWWRSSLPTVPWSSRTLDVFGALYLNTILLRTFAQHLSSWVEVHSNCTHLVLIYLPGWYGNAQAAWQKPELLEMNTVLCSAAIKKKKVLIVSEDSGGLSLLMWYTRAFSSFLLTQS